MKLDVFMAKGDGVPKTKRWAKEDKECKKNSPLQKLKDEKRAPEMP
jgi:hypothetical protein